MSPNKKEADPVASSQEDVSMADAPEQVVPDPDATKNDIHNPATPPPTEQRITLVSLQGSSNMDSVIQLTRSESSQALQMARRHSSSRTRTTLWAMRCDILS
jgi:hypothetical protein